MYIFAIVFIVGSTFATTPENGTQPAETPAVVSDTTCTSGGTYTPKATVCENASPDKQCEQLFVSDGEQAVVAGSNAERPWKCFKESKNSTTASEDQKRMATAMCAKTCGYCCLSSAYDCEDARYPALTCSKITPAQCKESAWRDIIARDCPSACGFCNMGGCVDTVEGCQKQMCTAIGMDSFVNKNCRRTCDLCDKVAPAPGVTSTTTTSTPSPLAPSPGSGAPSSSANCVDAHPACRSWIKNGFCNNQFYAAHKGKYCRKSCNMC